MRLSAGEQHSSKETWQRWRAVGGSVSVVSVQESNPAPIAMCSATTLIDAQLYSYLVYNEIVIVCVQIEYYSATLIVDFKLVAALTFQRWWLLYLEMERRKNTW